MAKGNQMTSMNISLSNQMKEWVETQIKSGAYHNSSEYVRNLIRKDQEQKARDKAFIAAIEAGRNSPNSELSIDEIFKNIKNKPRAIQCD